MSKTRELVPVLIPTEMDQLKWANARLNCEILRKEAAVLTQRAEMFAMQSDGLMAEIRKQLANGSAEKYEGRIVEGQLQFHLTGQENDGNSINQ